MRVSFLLVLTVGFFLAWFSQLAGCLLLRHEGWDRALGLIIALAAMPFLAGITLPGDFAPGEDLSNGLLVGLLMTRIVGLWILAAVGALVFHSSARRVADRMRRSDKAEPHE